MKHLLAVHSFPQKRRLSTALESRNKPSSTEKCGPQSSKPNSSDRRRLCKSLTLTSSCAPIPNVAPPGSSTSAPSSSGRIMDLMLAKNLRSPLP
ncbi:hypothetical protein L596_021622 [Steinernema carpocapsae]|uniref:Uncharacterized protein n=1 Tax=Steinernema carpocapsae TaxID=34508 RepID=A0A4U5MJC3_STECR|nr:hypothetical protein L596_021622 [Steinernema carpocapsae]